MSDEFHKPTQYSGDKFDTYEGGADPAQIMRVAQDTAHAKPGKAAAAAASADESVTEAGRAAAMNGMKTLTAWWGALTARQRSELNTEFPKLRKAAQSADQGGHYE